MLLSHLQQDPFTNQNINAGKDVSVILDVRFYLLIILSGGNFKWNCFFFLDV